GRKRLQKPRSVLSAITAANTPTPARNMNSVTDAVFVKLPICASGTVIIQQNVYIAAQGILVSATLALGVGGGKLNVDAMRNAMNVTIPNVSFTAEILTRRSRRSWLASALRFRPYLPGSINTIVRSNPSAGSSSNPVSTSL